MNFHANTSCILKSDKNFLELVGNQILKIKV